MPSLPTLPHTVMIDLGTLGGRGSYGVGINDNGQVTGWAETSTGGAHAFLTNAAHTVMTDLGSLGGSSQGHAVNAKGQVTGFSFLAGESVRHAFVTDGGNMRDLNALLVSNDVGWLLRDGNGINDAGQISGTGLINGQDHAFLLTPVLFRVVCNPAFCLFFVIPQKDGGGSFLLASLDTLVG